jgi:hypothetical protein
MSKPETERRLEGLGLDEPFLRGVYIHVSADCLHLLCLDVVAQPYLITVELLNFTNR